VLTDDTLALISSGLLSPQKVDELRADFGEDDNPSFSPSPKESKVAKALGRPQPSSAAEGGSNLKPLFEEAAAGEEVEGGGGAKLTPPTARKPTPRPQARSARAAASPTQTTNKQVVDSTIASQLVEILRGIQEQLTEVLFRRASASITGGKGPQLSLADLNPVVGAQIRAVVEGQLALLYTARATAHMLARNGSQRAQIIADSLSEAEFAATVFQAVREEGATSPSPLDVALGIPAFGRVAVLAVAPLLLGGTSELEEQLAKDCLNVSISNHGGELTIELGRLKQTLATIAETGATVDYRDPTKTLVGKITNASSIVFEGKVRGKPFQWEGSALKIAEEAVKRKQRGEQPSRNDFDDIMQLLKDAAFAVAGKSDLKREASGGTTSVFSVSSASAAASAAEDEDDAWRASIFAVGKGPAVQACPVTEGCSGKNPDGSFICVTCKQFLADVHPCTKCRLPARAGSACRIWFCDGKAGAKETNQGKLSTCAVLWTERNRAANEARAKQRRD